MFRTVEKEDDLKDKIIAVVNFHNYYGNSSDLINTLNKRKLCAQHMFDSVEAAFPKGSKLFENEVQTIIIGDFNLDITTNGGNNNPSSEMYFLNSQDVVQKTNSITTIGGKSYDKVFVNSFFKALAGQANVYQEYLVPASGTSTNNQSDVSDHLPLVMYLKKE